MRISATRERASQTAAALDGSLPSIGRSSPGARALHKLIERLAGRRQLRGLAGYPFLTFRSEMRHAFALVPVVLDLELAQFLAAQRVEHAFIDSKSM